MARPRGPARIADTIVSRGDAPPGSTGRRPRPRPGRVRTAPGRAPWPTGAAQSAIVLRLDHIGAHAVKPLDGALMHHSGLHTGRRHRLSGPVVPPPACIELVQHRIAVNAIAPAQIDTRLT